MASATSQLPLPGELHNSTEETPKEVSLPESDFPAEFVQERMAALRDTILLCLRQNMGPSAFSKMEEGRELYRNYQKQAKERGQRGWSGEAYEHSGFLYRYVDTNFVWRAVETVRFLHLILKYDPAVFNWLREVSFTSGSVRILGLGSGSGCSEAGIVALLERAVGLGAFQLEKGASKYSKAGGGHFVEAICTDLGTSWSEVHSCFEKEQFRFEAGVDLLDRAHLEQRLQRGAIQIVSISFVLISTCSKDFFHMLFGVLPEKCLVLLTDCRRVGQ